MALPLQLIVVGPIARGVLGKMQAAADKASAPQEKTDKEID